MLNATIFGLALLLSIYYIINTISLIQTHILVENSNYNAVIAALAVIAWSWLYYLSH